MGPATWDTRSSISLTDSGCEVCDSTCTMPSRTRPGAWRVCSLVISGWTLDVGTSLVKVVRQLDDGNL